MAQHSYSGRAGRASPYSRCNRCGGEADPELRSPLCRGCYRAVLDQARAELNQGGLKTQNARKVKKLKRLRADDDEAYDWG